jgi:hypothetical protein
MNLSLLYSKLHSEFGHLHRYTKQDINLDYLYDAAPYAEAGHGFMLPSLGTEVLDLLSLVDKDPSQCAYKMILCESDPFILDKIYEFYKDIGCVIFDRPIRLHEAVSKLAGPITYGHADFEGMVGSRYNNATSTFTFDLIYNLQKNLGQEALFAFTHYKKMRNAKVLRNTYRLIHKSFSILYAGALNEYKDFLMFDSTEYHSDDFTLNNRCLAYHPSVILSFYFALTIGDSYHVEVWRNKDYESTSWQNSNELKMNKTEIRLEKGGYDPYQMLESFKTQLIKSGTTTQ